MHEYGPIPVSRLKEEASSIFEALQAGYKVLIARHGQVVASMVPPSLQLHGAELAAFAVRDSSVAELSASDIGQGSPSAAVRRAEAGMDSLVTRGNKVYGVLTGPPAPTRSLRDAEAEERELVAFERAHPNASAEEFAAASQAATARVEAARQAALPTGDVAIATASHGGSLGRESLRDEVLVDALLVKGLALEEGRDPAAAGESYQAAIDRFEHHPDARVRNKAAQAMVELARIRVAEGHPKGAVELADEALELLGTDDPATRQGLGGTPSSSRTRHRKEGKVRGDAVRPQARGAGRTVLGSA